MKHWKAQLLAVLAFLATICCATAQTTSGAGVPYPQTSTPAAMDLGDLAAQPNASPMSITVVLQLRDLNGAEALLHSLHTPGDPQFHQFLSSQDFETRFAPTNASVATVAKALAAYGLKTEQTTATTLKVSGLPADMERAFSVSLHTYAIPSRGNVPGYTYHAPLTRPTVPAAASALIVAVAGLDSRPSFRPRRQVAMSALVSQQAPVSLSSHSNAPQFLTVKDFANLYDVQPLYKQGVSGSGRTIGIMSLAGFTPSDVFAYWNAVGLSVRANRLQVVNVDGGPGAPSDASGSDETTLDIEQAGGIAPGANILVYLAPNTNQGFVDLFAAAIDANKADTLSISWGNWEWFNNLDNAPVSNPGVGGPATISTLQAIHQLLVRAAIQGQSVFAASGDSGAFDMNGDLGCFPSTSPSCNEPLTVDYPASDPAITAGGGTTLPEFRNSVSMMPARKPLGQRRSRAGMGMGLSSGSVQQAWRARPDRVRNLPRGNRRRCERFLPDTAVSAFRSRRSAERAWPDFVYDGAPSSRFRRIILERCAGCFVQRRSGDRLRRLLHVGRLGLGVFRDSAARASSRRNRTAYLRCWDSTWADGVSGLLNYPALPAGPHGQCLLGPEAAVARDRFRR